MDSIKNLPIGVFDSGIGGLNVLYKLSKTFKNENFIYFGDNSNAPYGSKTKTELYNLCANAVDRLVNAGVKAVVIACNTASTNCLNKLKKERPNLPIIGTFPCLINNERTLLFSTPKTANSAFVKNNFTLTKVVPLKTLAKDIENFYINGTPINLEQIKRRKNFNAQSVVLGCTHYIYLKKEFKSIFKCTICDGLNEVCARLKSQIKGLESTVKGQSIYFIGDSAEFNFFVYKSAFGVKNGCQVVKIPKKI